MDKNAPLAVLAELTGTAAGCGAQEPVGEGLYWLQHKTLCFAVPGDRNTVGVKAHAPCLSWKDPLC